MDIYLYFCNVINYVNTIFVSIMKIENHISESVKEAIKALYGQEVPEKMIQLQKTKATFEGHLTLVVFPFLKMSKKKT